MDENVTQRIQKFSNLISQKKTFRVSVKIANECRVGPVNHAIKLDTKIICTLETDMSKLFESNKKRSAVVVPDTNILWDNAPFTEYEKFRLNDNFR